MRLAENCHLSYIVCTPRHCEGFEAMRMRMQMAAQCRAMQFPKLQSREHSGRIVRREKEIRNYSNGLMLGKGTIGMR